MGEVICKQYLRQCLISKICKKAIQINNNKKQTTQLKMCRGSQQILFSRKHKNNQQIYEKMLNFSNYKRNVNPKHNKVLLYTC